MSESETNLKEMLDRIVSNIDVLKTELTAKTAELDRANKEKQKIFADAVSKVKELEDQFEGAVELLEGAQSCYCEDSSFDIEWWNKKQQFIAKVKK